MLRYCVRNINDNKNERKNFTSNWECIDSYWYINGRIIQVPQNHEICAVQKYFSLYFATTLEWWWNTTESLHIYYVILIPPLQTIISNSFLSSKIRRRRRVNIVSISRNIISEYVLCAFCIHFLPAQGTPLALIIIPLNS